HDPGTSGDPLTGLRLTYGTAPVAATGVVRFSSRLRLHGLRWARAKAVAASHLALAARVDWCSQNDKQHVSQRRLMRSGPTSAKSIPSHAHAGMVSSLVAESNPASEARMRSNWAVCRSTST